VDASCNLALGAGICIRAEQALPTASEADEQSYRIDQTYINGQVTGFRVSHWFDQ